MKSTVKVLIAAAAFLTSTFAAAETVVIVNPKNPASRMFTEQAAQFFLGKSTMFLPVDLPENSPVRAEFYQKVAGKDVGEVKAVWSRIVFTGRGVPPKEYASSADIKKAIASNVSAIGYIEKSAVDDTVKVILSIP